MSIEISTNNLRPLFTGVAALLSANVLPNLSVLVSGAFSRGYTPTPIGPDVDKIQVPIVKTGVDPADGTTYVPGVQTVSAEGRDQITKVATIGIDKIEVALAQYARRVEITRSQAQAYLQLLQMVASQPSEEAVQFAESQLMEVAGAIRDEFTTSFISNGFAKIDAGSTPTVRTYICTGTSGPDTNLPTAQDFIDAKMMLFGDLAPFMTAPDWVVVLHPNVAAYIEKLPQATQPITFGDPKARYFGQNVHITNLVNMDNDGYYVNYLIRRGAIKYFVPEWSGTGPLVGGIDITGNNLSSMFIVEEPVRYPERSLYSSIFTAKYAQWVVGSVTQAVKFLCKLPS